MARQTIVKVEMPRELKFAGEIKQPTPAEQLRYVDEIRDECRRSVVSSQIGGNVLDAMLFEWNEARRSITGAFRLNGHEYQIEIDSREAMVLNGREARDRVIKAAADAIARELFTRLR